MSDRQHLSASFLLSAAHVQQCPQDDTLEVAFVGRSNAGKSSSFNRIMGNRRLARTSKTPGRTRLINLFTTTYGFRVADLPGYGYAKASQQSQRAWNEAVDAYLNERANLHGLVLVMDSRHPLKPFDQEMLSWAADREILTRVLLNKADKLKNNARNNALREVKAFIADHQHASTQLFSASSGMGLENAIEWLTQFSQE